jgi:hypothetical protein
MPDTVHPRPQKAFVAVLIASVIACVAMTAFAPRAEAETEWFDNLPVAQQRAVVDFVYLSSPMTTVPYAGEAKSLRNTSPKPYLVSQKPRLHMRVSRQEPPPLSRTHP